MPRQLTFELAPTPPRILATFVAGRNAEVVDTVARFASHDAQDTGLVLWGASGAGKTHLLEAAVAMARERGRRATFVADVDAIAPMSVDPAMLVAVDRVDLAGDHAQSMLFTLFNALAAQRGQLVVSSGVPPARMPLRDDLRTRLGWGLVLEVVPLADDEKADALATFAQARGFRLAPDAIAYLLAHGRRDMASLVRTLLALDRHSLALQRPVTVPLIRDWLQRDIELSAGGDNGK